LRKDQTMKRKRHTEEQIIAILKEHEAGVKTADLAASTGSARQKARIWQISRVRLPTIYHGCDADSVSLPVPAA
jgi:hypothetical protein